MDWDNRDEEVAVVEAVVAAVPRSFVMADATKSANGSDCALGVDQAFIGLADDEEFAMVLSVGDIIVPYGSRNDGGVAVVGEKGNYRHLSCCGSL